MKRIRIIVSGLVQGVGFRRHTRKKAQLFELKGFVRNLQDTTVEIEAEGNEADLNGFIEWVQKGTPYARVETVDVTEIPPVLIEDGFRTEF